MNEKINPTCISSRLWVGWEKTCNLSNHFKNGIAKFSSHTFIGDLPVRMGAESQMNVRLSDDNTFGVKQPVGRNWTFECTSSFSQIHLSSLKLKSV